MFLFIEYAGKYTVLLSAGDYASYYASFLPRARWEDWYHSRLYVKYEGTASSWLA